MNSETLLRGCQIRREKAMSLESLSCVFFLSRGGNFSHNGLRHLFHPPGGSRYVSSGNDPFKWN